MLNIISRSLIVKWFIMNFGKRLKSILNTSGVQQTKIAEVVGLSSQQVSRLVNKDQQPRNALELAEKISEIADVNPHWLAFGIGDMRQITNNKHLIVQFGDELEGSNKKIPITSDEDCDNLIAFRIDSTALEPEIPKGAIAVINKAKKPQDGNFILIKNSNNNLMIRKIYFTTTGITLSSAIDKVNCSASDIEILGVVQEFRIIF